MRAKILGPSIDWEHTRVEAYTPEQRQLVRDMAAGGKAFQYGFHNSSKAQALTWKDDHNPSATLDRYVLFFLRPKP